MLDKILFILCLYCIYVNKNIDPNFYDLWMILWNEWHWKKHQLLADTTAYHGFIQEPQTCMTNHRPFRTKKGLCVWLTHHEAFQNLNANLAFIRFFHLKGRINKNKVEQRMLLMAASKHPIAKLDWPSQRQKGETCSISQALPMATVGHPRHKNSVKVFLQIRGGKKLGDHLIMIISRNEKRDGKLWWIAMSFKHSLFGNSRYPQEIAARNLPSSSPMKSSPKRRWDANPQQHAMPMFSHQLLATNTSRGQLWTSNLEIFWKNTVKTHLWKNNLGFFTGGTNVLITAHIRSYEKHLGFCWRHTNKKIRANQPCKPWQIHLAFIDSIVKDLWIVEKKLLITVDGSEIRITLYNIWNPVIYIILHISTGDFSDFLGGQTFKLNPSTLRILHRFRRFRWKGPKHL